MFRYGRGNSVLGDDPLDAKVVCLEERGVELRRQVVGQVVQWVLGFHRQSLLLGAILRQRGEIGKKAPLARRASGVSPTGPDDDYNYGGVREGDSGIAEPLAWINRPTREPLAFLPHQNGYGNEETSIRAATAARDERFYPGRPARQTCEALQARRSRVRP